MRLVKWLKFMYSTFDTWNDIEVQSTFTSDYIILIWRVRPRTNGRSTHNDRSMTFFLEYKPRIEKNLTETPEKNGRDYIGPSKEFVTTDFTIFFFSKTRIIFYLHIFHQSHSQILYRYHRLVLSIQNSNSPDLFLIENCARNIIWYKENTQAYTHTHTHGYYLIKYNGNHI